MPCSKAFIGFRCPSTQLELKALSQPYMPLSWHTESRATEERTSPEPEAEGIPVVYHVDETKKSPI